jgi:phage terminase large subunit-like protein
MAGLSSATKRLEELVLSNTLRRDGHPILRWCASNVVVNADANGNIRPLKRRTPERLRIDGISALVTALARAMVATEMRSVYDTRGVIVL